MVIGIGIDNVDTGRIKESIEKYGDRFVKKIFTETEKEYCNRFKGTEHLHFAARFAAKEAFSKAVGTGFAQGFKTNQVGVRNIKGGKPEIELFGEMADKYGKYKSTVSLTHTDGLASAFVVLEE
ncbi:MAG: holo-ACP synthase [Candidatus Kapaibacteriales bacterium]